MRMLADTTPFEQKKMEEIVHYQRTSERKRELLICLSSDGTHEVVRVEGEVNRVNLPYEVEELLLSGQHTRLFHNHPSESSLSDADWRQSTRWKGRAEIVVLNSSGSVFLGAAKNVDDFSILSAGNEP